MSLLNFTITAWNLQAKDHIAKDELNHSSAIGNENINPVKHFHQNFTNVFTHVAWTLSSIIVYSGSLVFLLLLAYIEMFSNYLMDTGFKVNIHLLPFLIILSNIPVNIILYKIFINNKDSFSLAHAILSPIKPCRYEIISYDIRPHFWCTQLHSPPKWRFLPKNLNQLVIFLIGLAFT